MAHAKLHIICGNCGCNDMFDFKINPKGIDVTVFEPQYKPEIYISCRNCGTLHGLSDNAKYIESNIKICDSSCEIFKTDYSCGDKCQRQNTI